MIIFKPEYCTVPTPEYSLSVPQLQFSLEPDPVAVNCTAFNHNGNLLVTGAADGVIRLFGQSDSIV